MIIEWDDEKRHSTLVNRGLDFQDAEKVLSGRTVERTQVRSHETRYLAIGRLDDRYVILVYTMRGDAHRIISMRYANKYANKREREIYEQS